jgi:hypothetical protein
MAAQQDKLRLGELLVESGILSPDQLVYALADQRHGSERIGETLLRLGFLERPQLWAALAEQHVRRFIGVLGITAMAFHPGLAMAGNVRSQMLVSVTVVNTATTDIRMIGAGTPGAGSASISLACNASGTAARIGIEHGRFEPQPAGASVLGAAAAPAYVVTWRSDKSATVACGSIPQAIIAPTELAADRDAASARGLTAVNVVVAY